MVAAEQLAYRTLAACWAAERDADIRAASDTAANLAEQVAALRGARDEGQ